MNRSPLPDASPSRASAMLIGFLAGLIGGLAGGWLMLPSGGTRDAGGGDAARGMDRSTLAAVSGLTQELAALRSELVRRDGLAALPAPLVRTGSAYGADGADGAQSGEADAAAGATDVALTTDEAVARLASMLASTLATGSGDGRGSPDREPLVDDGPDPAQRPPWQADLLARLGADLEVDDVDRVPRRFLLWTERQIVARFGRPDYIHVSDGSARWVYELSEDRTVEFSFLDGLVVNCW